MMKRKIGELIQLPETCGRGGAGWLFFPVNMRMSRMPPTVPTMEPITGGTWPFFQLPEVVGLLLRLLDQGIRLIDDIQREEATRIRSASFS